MILNVEWRIWILKNFFHVYVVWLLYLAQPLAFIQKKKKERFQVCIFEQKKRMAMILSKGIEIILVLNLKIIHKYRKLLECLCCIQILF